MRKNICDQHIISLYPDIIPLWFVAPGLHMVAYHQSSCFVFLTENSGSGYEQGKASSNFQITTYIYGCMYIVYPRQVCLNSNVFLFFQKRM